jgi:hypothetical protein
MNVLRLFTTPAAALACAMATLSISAPAGAQGTASERSACMGDALSFCGAFVPDVDRITACLKQNVSRLSPACRAEFEQPGQSKMRTGHFRQ